MARYGGDEFALLLPQANADVACQIANRVRETVASLNFDVGLRGERVSVTFSMGLALIREGDSAESLIRRADAALYKSKSSGRNQLHCQVEEELMSSDCR